MSVDDLERYYLRYLTILEIVNIANKLASPDPRFRDHNIYEIRNCIERFLLTRANQDNINILNKKEIGYIQLIDELKNKTRNRLDIVAPVVNEIRKKVHEFVNRDLSQVKGDRSQLIVGNSFVQYRDYVRNIEPERIAAKKTTDPELSLGLMIMMYASILPGPQHWNASEQHYRIYYQHGIRVEGFASPINAQLLAIDETTKFCSLFPQVDSIFGSLGSFFDVEFGSEYEKVAVGPPYTAELLNRIADKLIRACEGPHRVRFYVTHANWADAEGYIKMLKSKYLVYHEVVPRGKHYYMNTNVVPNEKIVAQFETVLFVLTNYQDEEDFTDLLNGLKL